MLGQHLHGARTVPCQGPAEAVRGDDFCFSLGGIPEVGVVGFDDFCRHVEVVDCVAHVQVAGRKYSRRVRFACLPFSGVWYKWRWVSMKPGLMILPLQLTALVSESGSMISAILVMAEPCTRRSETVGTT